MHFGSARTTKATAATELAALAAWRTLDSGDRVGTLIFTDDDVVEIRPHRSRSNVLRICHELVQANAKLSADRTVANSTSLNDAFRLAVNVAKHDHLVILITDFDGADQTTRKHAAYLAAHNDVMAVMVYDPLGLQLPVRGTMRATDGKHQIVVPVDSSFEGRFEAAFRERCDQLREHLAGIRIPILPICTHDAVVDQVKAALGSPR